MFLSRLHDFDQDIFIGNAANSEEQNIEVNEGTLDQNSTVNHSASNLKTNENSVNGQKLERCSNEKVDREMGNIVNTVKDRIQNAMFTAIDVIITPKNE